MKITPGLPFRLRRGEFLCESALSSPSGRFVLVNSRSTGQTAVSDTGSGAVRWWLTSEKVYGQSLLVLGLDGDLAVWNHHRERGWHSGTAGSGAEELRLTDAGEVELVAADDEVVWSSAGRVFSRPEHWPRSRIRFGLRRGESLDRQWLSSPDGGTLLHPNPTGSLILSPPRNQPGWSLPSGPGSDLVLGVDGRLVLVRDGRVETEIAGPGEELVLLPGRAELRDAEGAAVWTVPGDGPGQTVPPDDDRDGQQLRLRVLFDSLSPAHGYTVAVVQNVVPEEALRRWGLTADAMSRATWPEFESRRQEDSVPVAAVPLGPHTLLVAGAPDFPGDPLSAGTTVTRESRIPVMGYSTEFSMHQDGDTVSLLHERRPKRRRGMSRPELLDALARAGVEEHSRTRADWHAAFAGLELLCQVADVSPTAGDLNGELLGGLVPASIARPWTEPMRTPSPGRPSLRSEYFLLVRTDFSDEAAWASLLEELASDEFFQDADIHPVQDRGWEGADPDEVLAALPDLDRTDIFYLADRETMTQPGHPVLVVNTTLPAAGPDYEPVEGVSRSLRATAAALWSLHLNLEIANLSWEEYLPRPGSEDPVHRGF